jgi:hypothetical protein
MLYARGTVEDPTLHSDSSLAAVLPHSRRSADFTLPEQSGELLRLLIGDDAPVYLRPRPGRPAETVRTLDREP